MHIQQNHMKQNIKVDLDIVKQTLQDIQNHLKGRASSKNFYCLSFEDLSYSLVTLIINICNTKGKGDCMHLFVLRD